MDDDNIYSVAQFSLFRPEHITTFIEALYLESGDDERAMRDLVGWNQVKINHVRQTCSDPVLEMFKELKLWGACNGFCRNPNVHFDEKKCAPIGIVFNVLKGNELIKRVFQDPRVKDRIVNDVRILATQDRVTLEPTLPLYTVESRSRFAFLTKLFSLCSMKKPIEKSVDVLLVDSYADEGDVQASAPLYNLLLNFEKNFTLFIASDIQDRDINLWKEYTQFQIHHNADCIVVLATQFVIDNFQGDADSAIDISAKRIAMIGEIVRNSQKRIFAVALTPEMASKARVITPFVFTIPNQLCFLIDMISRIRVTESSR